MKMLKKGQNSSLGLIVSIAVGLLVVTITVAISAYTATTFGDEMPDNSAAQNVTVDMVDTISILPSWTKIFVIVAIGVGLIGLVAGVAYMFSR
jgi:hypothetical protein